MTTRMRWLSAAVLAWATALFVTDVVAGPLPGSGKVEVGAVPGDRDSNSSKYEEYRDIPRDSPLVDELRLDLESEEKDYYAEFRGEDVGQDDQGYVLTVGRYGKFEMVFRWDELPHVYSNGARSLFRSEGDGVFTIPDEIQTRLQNDPTLGATLLSGAPGVPLRLGRDTGSFSLRYTPTPEWELDLGYTARSDDGRKPFGQGTFFGRAQPIETFQPVDWLTHEIRAGAQYAAATWSVRLSYVGSIFDNDIDSVTWDNPFQAEDAFGNPSRGRADLAPDNQAHDVSLNGGWSLPWWHARMVGMVSYGRWTQDDDFLPFTINSALPAVGLPETSLDGELNPLTVYSRFTARPLDRVTLKVSYRLYDLGNDSRSIVFPSYVAGDALPGDSRRNLPYEYTVHRAGFGATYDVTSWADLNLDWDWENWDRKFREVENTDEHTVGPSLDFRMASWLLGRLAYAHSWRDSHGYDTFAPDALAFPDGEGVEHPKLEALRKFDEATRERDEVTVLLRFTPRQALSLVTSFTYGNDDYTRSDFGLLRSTRWSPAVDLYYMPMRRLGMWASYVYEEYEYRQRSRARGVEQIDGRQVATDDPADDWTSESADSVHTVGGGLELTIVPDRLRLTVDYSISQAFGRIDTGGPNPEAEDFPNVKSRYQELTAAFRYDVGRGVYVRTGYRYERYDETDFATTAIVGGDDIQPWMGDVSGGAARSEFLGAFVPDYTAHLALLSLGYEW